MSDSRVVEWLNENAERAYPLQENANRYLVQSSLRVDLYRVVLDAVLQFDELPDIVRLESIVTDGSALLLTVTGQSTFIVENYLTTAYPYLASNAENSRIMIGDEVLRIPVNRTLNTQTLGLDVRFEYSVCHEVSSFYSGVTSLQFNDEAAQTGDIALKEGFQLTLNPNTSGFSVEVGRNEGVPLGCEQIFDIIPAVKEDLVDTVNAEIRGYIAGKTAVNGLGGTTALFTPFVENTTNIAFNPNNWAIAAGIDMTWCGINGQYKYALITPRHVIQAAHVARPYGSYFKFLDSNNVIHTRNIVARATMMPEWLPPDVTVLLLDEDVPATVKPVKILPRNYINYFRDVTVAEEGTVLLYTIAHLPRMSICSVNQTNHTSIMDTNLCYLAGPPPGYFSQESIPRYPDPSSETYPWRVPTSGPYVGGDSSCPMFAVVDGQAALLWTFTGGSGGGSDICRTSEMVNSMIATLDSLYGITSGYQLTTVDLSRFTKYNNLTDANGMLDMKILPTPVNPYEVVHRDAAIQESTADFVASDCGNIVSFVNGVSPNKTGEAVYLEGVKHVKVYQDSNNNRIYIGLDFVEQDVKHQRLPNPPTVV